MPGKKGGEVPTGQSKTPTLGQINYEAYVAAGMQDAGFSSASGARLPSWPDAEGRIQARWEAAASAVAEHVLVQEGIHDPPPSGAQ